MCSIEIVLYCNVGVRTNTRFTWWRHRCRTKDGIRGLASCWTKERQEACKAGKYNVIPGGKLFILSWQW